MALGEVAFAARVDFDGVERVAGFGGTDLGGVDGLVCSASFGGAGYCTASCMLPDGDCGDVADAAGDLTPECTAVIGPGAGMMGRCTLDCSEDEEGCPDGMTCINMGGGMGGVQRCGYETP